METIPELIGNAFQTGEIRYPSGNGKVSFVSRIEIAEALSIVMTENSRQNQVYEITGNTAYSFADLAQIINAEKKMDIQHIDISDAIFKEELIGYQMPMEVVELMVSMAKGIKVGEFSYTSNTLEKLIDRKPLSLKEFIKNL
tara:strand:+ start:33 stop:458 length:426 start_codon:yes stop_codon:yes gene_type:complete